MKALKSFILCALVCIVPLIGQSQDRKITELFQVSNIGVPNAAEQTDKLIELFNSIQKQYQAEMDEQGISGFKGDQVRIIKVLDSSDSLYMVAYGGGPSVAKIEGDQSFRAGQLTPPLIITRDGEHLTSYDRRVPIKTKTEGKPQLKTVSKSSGATFFGIPIGGGGASEPEEEITYTIVPETKTLKKYAAKVSTEKIDNRPRTMSKDLFLSRLKNGEVFEVNQDETRRCRGCNGWSRIIPKNGETGGRDGKISCPECEEAGELEWDVTYQVTW